jgi:hypothetical protein
MKSNVNSIYYEHDGKRICQGDIFRDLKYPERYLPQDIDVDVDELKIPYLVVLSQDCDLLSDCWNRNDILKIDCDTGEDCSEKEKDHDKLIPSILVCPAYPVNLFKEGKHLEKFDYQMQDFRKKDTMWNFVITNQNSRYHFLKAKTELEMPKVVIDFKQYYTIPRDILYEILYEKFEEHYLLSLNELFREELSHRFANYLSRVGVPLIPKKKKHNPYNFFNPLLHDILKKNSF